MKIDQKKQPITIDKDTGEEHVKLQLQRKLPVRKTDPKLRKGKSKDVPSRRELKVEGTDCYES